VNYRSTILNGVSLLSEESALKINNVMVKGRKIHAKRLLRTFLSWQSVNVVEILYVLILVYKEVLT
jgi:hypothetical protein